MRVLTLLLSLLLGLGPVTQVYAATMSEAHCHLHGHVTGDAAMVHAAAAHAGHSTGMTHANHVGGHCNCGCLCNLACSVSPAVIASMPSVTQSLAHENWSAALVASPVFSVHESPLRPPSYS